MSAALLQAVAICAVSWLLWKYFRQVVIRSPLDNIPGPPSEGFVYGNLKQILARDAEGMLQDLTDSYPGVIKLAGPLGHRMLYVFDPDAMHNIIVKEQYIYEESQTFIKSNQLHFGPSLLATLGEHHRKQRKLLNPVFSIAHMRRMLPMFMRIGQNLQQAIENRITGHSEMREIDILSWMSRTALELIGQAGLGYSFDPLVADTADEFGDAVKAFQVSLMHLLLLERLVPYVMDFGTPAIRRKLVEWLPHREVQKMIGIVDTLHRKSTEIYEGKKRAIEQGDQAVINQVGEGKDLMSIMLRANMAAQADDRLPEEEIIAQVATFIFAGMDTTSNALSVTLSILADHPDAQQKLREEILASSNGGENLDYDTLTSLPYLDAVCRETLRLHPPAVSIFRETRQDVVLPLSTPIRGLDGRDIKEIPVPKDTVVVIGILSANRNKAIWGEDATEWKPERWLSPLPDSVTNAKIPGVYSNLMTFLGGGRACIGFKFSQLEMKVILCLLLTKFTFAPSDKHITWNISAVRFPTVGGSDKPCLPLKVGLYKPTTH